MSLSEQTNKWTPKLIIIVQLTAWSIVGIMLLRKGVKSLRDIEGTLRQNDTADIQESIVDRTEKDSIQGESNIPENNRDGIEEMMAGKIRRRIDGGTWLPQKSNKYASYRAIDTESVLGVRTTIDRKQDPRGIRAIQTLIDQPVLNKSKTMNNGIIRVNGFHDGEMFHEVEEENSSNKKNDDDEEEFASGNHDVSTGTTILDQNDNFASSTSIEKIDRKIQRAPANRIGVAVAITMLAIGVVMLLLGPLIVIIRAYSDRRTRQIFLKSRCHADRPPTYEEVVLMDQAPRYSTLHLETNPESPLSL